MTEPPDPDPHHDNVYLDINIGIDVTLSDSSIIDKNSIIIFRHKKPPPQINEKGVLIPFLYKNPN